MCDQPLEKALGMKDLHVIEIHDQILKQTTMMKRQEWRDNFNTFISTSKGRTASARPPAEAVNRSTTLFSDKEVKFIVKPSLMRLLKTGCEKKDQSRASFKYNKVASLLTEYLIRRRNALFDPRNLQVARVHLDPLGKVFGVARFHKSQVRNLWRAQLTPSHSDTGTWRITTRTTKQGIQTSNVTEVQRKTSPITDGIHLTQATEEEI